MNSKILEERSINSWVDRHQWSSPVPIFLEVTFQLLPELHDMSVIPLYAQTLKNYNQKPLIKRRRDLIIPLVPKGGALQLFIHSFKEYLLISYYVPGILC